MTGCGVPAFVADLHIHSKYSRACSRDLELESLAWWARRKGITLLGTGDFTHPAWHDHLRENLVPAEPGLYRLTAEKEAGVLRRLPPRLAGSDQQVRFLLSVEISTIYKRADRTRKVHHLVYLPDLDAVARFNARLGRVGNLGADCRPILGLDSRDLLEITLEASPDGYLVPAHVWTPWFSALGSKSGFDAVADCYADLAEHIFAVETGLSSDPAMNWRVSSLDSYRLVSNSDAHSPPALAREATLLDTALDYYAVREALRTGDGLQGTIEFFPEEGKYHADGHRVCGVNWEPRRTRAAQGRCPECGKPLTVGVLHRVEELADRPEGHAPASAPTVFHMIQLHQVLGEIAGVGAKSKTVEGQINSLVAALGPELAILRTLPVADVAAAGGELLGEAVARLRRGQVHRTPGFDGEYGVIRLFEPAELYAGGDGLFDVPVPAQRRAPAPRRRTAPPAATPAPPLAPPPSPHEPLEPMLAGMEEVGTGLLDRLDAMQRVAASAPGGPLLVVAGPGTGKTRTLTHRIAYLCAESGVRPEQCLAITFTRAAAAGLSEHLRVAEEADRLAAVAEAVGLSAAGSQREARRLLAALPTDEALREEYVKRLHAKDLVDLDELLTSPVRLLTEHPSLVDRYRSRWPWVFVDEYQDVDPVQYALLRLLCPPDGNLCTIGDPDQAIYSFRGGDVSFFLQFGSDFTEPRMVRLTRNYRSSAPILAAAIQAVAPTTLVPGRRLDPARLDPQAPLLGLYPAASVADEADFVVRTVDELVGGVSHRSLDSGRVDSRTATAGALSFSDIAVLYRVDTQAAPIVDALSRAGIPVQKRSHDRLLDRPGVAAIARELRFADGDRPPADAAQRSPRSNGRNQEALDGSLASRVRLAGQVLAERITLLTLHAAKGLEFPVVFLVGCEDGLLPLRLPGRPPSDDEVAEERRLFFVGLTRAQDRLFVSHTRRRFRHGAERQMAPSPFLAAIDQGLLERRGDDAPRRPRDQQLRLL